MSASRVDDVVVVIVESEVGKASDGEDDVIDGDDNDAEEIDVVIVCIEGDEDEGIIGSKAVMRVVGVKDARVRRWCRLAANIDAARPANTEEVGDDCRSAVRDHVGERLSASCAAKAWYNDEV